jgi:hypothetical protein
MTDVVGEIKGMPDDAAEDSVVETSSSSSSS